MNKSIRIFLTLSGLLILIKIFNSYKKPPFPDAPDASDVPDAPDVNIKLVCCDGKNTWYL